MKKISYEDAQKIIKTGTPVKALISRNYEPVNSLNKLEKLKRLDQMGVQKYELYFEPADTKIPEKAYVISLDEAINLLNSDEVIHSKLGGKEVSFFTAKDVISYHKNCIISGDPGLLYCYVS